MRKNLSKRLAFRLDDIPFDHAGGGRGCARLSAIPLVQDDRHLGAVILLEGTARAASLAEERAHEPDAG
jgi:hypothetical protein